jgi:hypothetical protein
MFGSRVRLIVFSVVMLGVMVLAMIVIPDSTVAAPVSSGSCSTRNLAAKDLGGGTPWNRNYVIEVYGIPRDDGHFIYYDHARRGFVGVRWHPTHLVENGVSFGVSTAWARTRPWWKDTYWIYVYKC